MAVRYVVRGMAVTDARSRLLQLDQPVVVDDHIIRWMGDDAEAEIPPGAVVAPNRALWAFEVEQISICCHITARD